MLFRSFVGLASAAWGQPTGVSETPYFAAEVQAGRLPAVADRLPDEPSVAEFGGEGTRE